MNQQESLDRVIHLFENLSPDNMDTLRELYTHDAYFKDPFNEVRGHAAIIGIFNHMFKKVDKPKFVVTTSILQGDDAFIVWDFMFSEKHKAHVKHRIHGSSHLRFGLDNKVHYHRDYWDAAEELYEKIPLLESLMRFLKTQVRS